LWREEIPEDKRVCPFRDKTCCPATFESCRQMLAHCRQKHPDTLLFGGDPPPGLVVTDTQGKPLSGEEIRQIIDHPSFWPDPQELARSQRRAEVA
jgi:hypothetical protein